MQKKYLFKILLQQIKKCIKFTLYGDNSYLFVNGKQELKFKAKDDQIVKEILCLGNISNDWTAANAQKTGFWGEIYDFAVDYTNTNIGDIYNNIDI